MDEQNKHIDKLIEKSILVTSELLELGKKIALSETEIVVAFVDTAESTMMKQDKRPEEWLGYSFQFIKKIEEKANKVGAEIIKRIGDELMVTFKNVAMSADFINSLLNDSLLQLYKYKIAIDSGKAYHFQFNDRIDDPYGTVVDRCARIRKLRSAGYCILFKNVLGSNC